jgi:hypothetical protein
LPHSGTGAPQFRLRTLRFNTGSFGAAQKYRKQDSHTSFYCVENNVYQSNSPA